MTRKKSSEVSKPNQQSQSNIELRRDRTRRVTRILKYAGLSVAGGSSLGIVHQLWQGNINNALKIGLLTVAATIIAIASKFISKLCHTILDRIETKLAEQTEPLATWIVKSLQARLLEIWWFLTSNFQGEYYQQLIYTCRDYLTQGLDKDRILQLKKVFVPLRIITQEARGVEPSMVQPIENRAKNLQDQKIWDFLAVAKNQYAFRHLVILAELPTIH